MAPPIIHTCVFLKDQQAESGLTILELHTAQLSPLILMQRIRLPACPSFTHLDMNLPFPSLDPGLLFHLTAGQFHPQTLMSAVVAPPSIGVV